MRDRGAKPADVAVACAVNPATVKRWLGGKAPTLDAVLDIAEFFGVNVRDLSTRRKVVKR